MSRPHLVPASDKKEIRLPFTGLYQSMLEIELDDDFERDMDSNGLTTEQCQDLFDVIHDATDYKKYNDLLCARYAEHVASLLNDEYGTNITFSEAAYIPMNGQNVGDYVVVSALVSELPSLEQLADHIGLDDIWDDLQGISERYFTSRSGFISFYDPNITHLKGAKYENWEEAYIMVLVELMCAHLPQTERYESMEHDLAGTFLEHMSCSDGVRGLWYQCVSEEDAQKIDDLLQGGDDE